ncbi:MAG: hypothetical protein U0903_02420 [Planctomycetales bacterium]
METLWITEGSFPISGAAPEVNGAAEGERGDQAEAHEERAVHVGPEGEQYRDEDPISTAARAAGEPDEENCEAELADDLWSPEGIGADEILLDVEAEVESEAEGGPAGMFCFALQRPSEECDAEGEGEGKAELQPLRAHNFEKAETREFAEPGGIDEGDPF